LLRAYGSEKYGRIIQQNLDQIKYLAERVQEEPLLELSAPVISNIVCFRYKPKGLNVEQVDELNRQIFQRTLMKTPGIFSDTTIKGRYTLRVCNVNHRTKYEDFDWLVFEVKRLGESLLTDVKKPR
jgi:aromatic-L-amino-acid decarboxylase